MKDILLDNDNDLKILNGDFVIGESLEQRQKLIVQSAKNDFKQFPEMGAGLEAFLDDDDSQALFAEIREQFKLDKMTLKSIGFDDEGNILIDGKDD